MNKTVTFPFFLHIPVPGDDIEYQLILGSGGNPNQLAVVKLGEGTVVNFTVSGNN